MNKREALLTKGVSGSVVIPIKKLPDGSWRYAPPEDRALPFNESVKIDEKDPCVRYCTTLHEWVHWTDDRPFQIEWDPIDLLRSWEYPPYVLDLKCLESFLD
jgi:hypothetical protein